MAFKSILPASLFTLIMAVFLLAWTSAAHAGFEWLQSPPAAPPAPVEKAEPITEMPSESATKKSPGWGDTVGGMTTLTPGAEPTYMKNLKQGNTAPTPPQQIVVAPAQPTPTPAAVQPTTATAPASIYPHAIGFGSDLPLAFALQQIIPEGYSHSFAKGTNMGSRVSWNGGKPWDQVIRDMVSPLGLDVTIENRNVQIHKKEAVPVAPVPQPVAQKTTQQQPATSAPTQLSPMPTTATPASTRAPVTSSGAGNTIQFWQGAQGQSIRDILIEWAPKANVQLVWQATENYTLANNILINDTFHNALTQMISQNMTGGRMPVVSLTGNTLLVQDRNG